MTGRIRARGLAVIAMIVWGLATAGPAGAIGHSPPAGARDVLAPLAPALLPPCQVHLVDSASGLARLSGPVHLVCDGPWALAGRGATVADMTLELFKATASGWAEQPTGNGSELDYAPEALGALDDLRADEIRSIAQAIDYFLPDAPHGGFREQAACQRNRQPQPKRKEPPNSGAAAECHFARVPHTTL